MVVSDERAARGLEEQTAHFPHLRKPHVVVTSTIGAPTALERAGHGDVRFDLVVGRNVLLHEQDREATFATIRRLLAEEGGLRLAESIPRYTQRLYALIDRAEDAELAAKFVASEEAIYQRVDDHMTNWAEEELRGWAETAGFTDVTIETDVCPLQQPITEQGISRWFSERPAEERPSYAQHLQSGMSAEEVECVRQQFTAQLLGKVVEWQSTVAFMTARATCFEHRCAAEGDGIGAS